MYDNYLGRVDEAIAFFRRAIDKFAEVGDVGREALMRANLAIRLRKLGRVDDARREIYRKIENDAKSDHGAEPWKSWDILTNIETDARNPMAAVEARRNAVECYVKYRRDGGENHSMDGRWCLAVTQRLLGGDPEAAASILQQVAADPNLPGHARTFIRALQAVVAGSRDRTLADAPDLHYTMTAEILFLLETLKHAGV